MHIEIQNISKRTSKQHKLQQIEQQVKQELYMYTYEIKTFKNFHIKYLYKKRDIFVRNVKGNCNI